MPSANSVWLVDGWPVGHFIVFWAPQACEVPKANLSAPFGMSDWMTTQRGWLVHGSWSRRWLNENHFFFISADHDTNHHHLYSLQGIGILQLNNTMLLSQLTSSCSSYLRWSCWSSGCCDSRGFRLQGACGVYIDVRPAESRLEEVKPP